MTLDQVRVATGLVTALLRKAVVLGVPLWFEEKGVGLVRVETRHGSDEYMVFTLINPVGEETPVALGKPWDYVVVGVVRGGEVVEERLDQVPYALATNPRVMPDYEADAWSWRIREYPAMRECGESREPRGKLLCSPSNPCVRAVRDEYGVAAWLDSCTGEFSDARPWQRRLGLRP